MIPDEIVRYLLHNSTGATLRSTFELLFLASIHFLQKLINYQANSSCVVMSLILMTTLFYKALMLQGEILMLITLRSYRVKSELAVQALFLLVDRDIRV